MEKEEVLKVLESEGRFKEYDDLYRDDVTLTDWVSRNEDLIRSNRNIAKAVGVDTPHGGVSDSYFEGQDIAKDKYEKQEKKLSDSQKEKQRLAEEYQRAKDIADFAEFRKDKGILGNLAALGMKLTPQAAKNVYIKEGYKPGKLALHGGIGTMANVSELMPGVGPVGKAVTTFAGPAIRAGQDIAEGKEAKDVASRFAHDAGLNTLFTYLPVKEAYNYGKRILGKQGGQGEKAVASTVEKELDKIDALENAKAAHQARYDMYKKVDDFERQYNKGLVTDEEVLNFAQEIEGTYPELAKQLRDHTNLLAKNREAARKALVEEFLENPEKAAKHQADELITSRKLPESNERVVNELNETTRNAKNNYEFGDVQLAEDGNLIRPLPDDNIARIWKENNPSNFARQAVKVLPQARGAARLASGPTRESSAPEDKDYNSAIEYIISNYSRQWDAGFKPNGGIELEAWKKYMGIK